LQGAGQERAPEKSWTIDLDTPTIALYLVDIGPSHRAQENPMMAEATIGGTIRQAMREAGAKGDDVVFLIPRAITVLVGLRSVRFVVASQMVQVGYICGTLVEFPIPTDWLDQEDLSPFAVCAYADELRRGVEEDQ
jgi:hypothetical protein